MEGDPNFSLSSLDDTNVDQFGVTLREWYSRMKNSMALKTRDSDFDRDSNRPWGREGNSHVTALLIAMRYTGDLTLLDEAVRLVELAWNKMTVAGGHRYWSGYDQELDVPLTAGLVACVAWACHLNRSLISPAGHNYGAISDKYRNWLLNDYKPRWEGITGRHGLLPWIKKDQQHTYVNNMRTLWYLGRLGGGGGHSQLAYFDAVAAMLTRRLADDAVCAAGHSGRNTRVYRHSVEGTGSTGGVLQYTTYVRYEISAYIDLMLDGADSRLDSAFFSEWANSLADFVCDGDPENTGLDGARCIGGDLLSDTTSCSNYSTNPTVNRCGITYHHCYRSRISRSRLVNSTYIHLAGWDSRNHAEPYIVSRYPHGGSSSAPTYLDVPAGRVFNRFYHGA
jgi:hypothetical protein